MLMLVLEYVLEGRKLSRHSPRSLVSQPKFLAQSRIDLRGKPAVEVPNFTVQFHLQDARNMLVFEAKLIADNISGHLTAMGETKRQHLCNQVAKLLFV